MEDSKTAWLSFRIDRERRRKIRMLAARDDLKIGDFMLREIERIIERERAKEQAEAA